MTVETGRVKVEPWNRWSTESSVKLEAAMVSKCANPACSATFRYFDDGRLFRVAIESAPCAGQFHCRLIFNKLLCNESTPKT
jgi:hypothetical protein